jgi:hypothetical protein
MLTRLRLGQDHVARVRRARARVPLPERCESSGPRREGPRPAAFGNARGGGGAVGGGGAEREVGGEVDLPVGAAGDQTAQKVLIPWIDQAFGRPTERVEHRMPTGLDELEFMSEEELERIVAQGRAERLKRLESEREDDEDGDAVS